VSRCSASTAKACPIHNERDEVGGDRIQPQLAGGCEAQAGKEKSSSFVSISLSCAMGRTIAGRWEGSHDFDAKLRKVDSRSQHPLITTAASHGSAAPRVCRELEKMTRDFGGAPHFAVSRTSARARSGSRGLPCSKSASARSREALFRHETLAEPSSKRRA